jgi:hypothetical protein
MIRKNQDMTAVEQLIENNSAEYMSESIWPYFSNQMTCKEFNDIIDNLHRTGRIAIDCEGYVVWILVSGSGKEIPKSREPGFLNMIFL